jgi:cytoskeletal protein RodZ
MIIDTKTIVITLVVVFIAFKWGLKFIQKFALQIAQENHDAVAAMDEKEEQQRLKKERAADTAASVAFSKVEPMLSVPKIVPAVGPKVVPAPSSTGSAALEVV